MTRVIWYIILSVSLLSFVAKAQPNGLSIYQFPKQIPLSYQLDIETEQAKMPYCEHSTLKKREFDYFTHTIIENRIHQINKGEIYLDWIEAELYVKRLLNRLLPDTLKNKKEINIFIRRDADPNAYSTYDASIYINMGLLADIKSEAALAFVLSHELAHYLGQHQLHNFQLFKQNEKKEEGKFKRLVHNNKLLELEADRVAAKIIQKAGFNVQDVYSVFDLIYSSENLFKKERIDNIKQVIDQSVNSTGFEDSAAFKKITRLSKYEKIHLLLNQFTYDRCLQNALRYYATDTSMQFLPYYIVESIRRHLLINPDDLNESVFDNINQHLNRAERDYTNKNYLQNTYHDFVSYFSDSRFVKNIPDLLFSKALYAYQMNKPDADDLFEAYLQLKASKQFTNLAKFLMLNSTYPKKHFQKSIAILENIGAYNLRESTKPFLDVSKSFSLNYQYNNKLKKNLSAKFPKQSILLQQDLMSSNYKKAEIYRQLSVATLLAQNIKDFNELSVQEILFLLLPTAFTLLEEEQVGEISYFKINAFKKDKKPKFTSVINPLSWIGMAFRSYLFGSDKYFYIVEQINLNQSTATIFYEMDTIKYRIKLPHLLNTMYESIKNAENCHDSLVEN